MNKRSFLRKRKKQNDDGNGKFNLSSFAYSSFLSDFFKRPFSLANCSALE